MCYVRDVGALSAASAAGPLQVMDRSAVVSLGHFRQFQKKNQKKSQKKKETTKENERPHRAERERKTKKKKRRRGGANEVSR